MISEGRFIYIISQLKSPSSSRFIVDSFDVMGFVHMQTIELKYEENLKGNRRAAPLHNMSLNNVTFYTNGSYLFSIILPPDAVHYGYKVNDTLCRCFCLQDGSLVSSDSIEEGIVGLYLFSIYNLEITLTKEQQFQQLAMM